MKVALTSISPNHSMAHAQPLAVKSWEDSGFKVVSLNGKAEIDSLKEQFPTVEFVESRTMQGIYKAPYIPISAFIDYAKEKQYEAILLINSDIVLKDEYNHLKKYLDWSVNGLVIANREDHDGTFTNAVRYQFGFDAFIIHSRFYDSIPQTMFCMGQTWWDYWLPFRFINTGKSVVLVREPLFYHQSHAVQYNNAEWVKMTKHFQWIENRIESVRPQQLTGEIYRYIRKRVK
jgi:hypothetical protein